MLGDEWGIEDLYPLSPLQEGLLFHSLYAPGSGVYLSQVLCRLAFRFDDPGSVSVSLQSAPVTD